MLGTGAQGGRGGAARAEGAFLTVDSACALSVACYWASAKTQLSLTRALGYAPGGLCAVANVASHLASLVLICLLARRAAPWASRRAAFLAPGCAFAAAAALLAASGGLSSPGLALLANVLAGAASAFALVLWGEGMPAARPSRYLAVMLLGAVVSLLVQLLCYGLPGKVLAAAPAALSCCSLALSRWAGAGVPAVGADAGPSRADPVLSDVPWRVLFACLVFSVPSAFNEVSPLGEQGAALLLAELAVLLLLIGAAHAAGSLGEGVLPTAATFALAGSMAFLPLLYGDEPGLAVGVLSGAGALAFRACLYTDLCLMAARRDAPFSLTFAAGTAFLDAGTIAGSLARMLLPADGQHAVGFALLTTYLVFLAGFLFMRAPRREGRQDAPQPPRSERQAGAARQQGGRQRQTTPQQAEPSQVTPDIERLAREHDLTQREKDILRLILQGKKTPNIAETLGLSVNTVKTHRKHLYQKLGCQSSEELFSMARGESKG